MKARVRMRAHARVHTFHTCAGHPWSHRVEGAAHAAQVPQEGPHLLRHAGGHGFCARRCWGTRGPGFPSMCWQGQALLTMCSHSHDGIPSTFAGWDVASSQML